MAVSAHFSTDLGQSGNLSIITAALYSIIYFWIMTREKVAELGSKLAPSSPLPF